MTHAEADALIDLEERIARELPEFINQVDSAIADEVEKRYGIPATRVLQQFERADSMDYTTVELIMFAHDRAIAEKSK